MRQCGIAGYGLSEQAADGRSIELADMNRKANDSAAELIHDHHQPVSPRKLLSDPTATEARVSAFHLDDGSDDLYDQTRL